jgi:hypothetical protein
MDSNDQTDLRFHDGMEARSLRLSDGVFMDLLHSLTGALIDRRAGMQQISLGDFNGWSYRATSRSTNTYRLLQSKLRRLR